MKMIVVSEAVPYGHGRLSSTIDGEASWSSVVSEDVIVGRTTTRSCGAIGDGCRDSCTPFSNGEVARMK
jgi:hypothetical protein